MRTLVARSALAALLAGALLAACQETTVAPGDCPELCPATPIEVVDTVLTGIVASDSSYRPYVTAAEAAVLKLSNDTAALAAAVLRFEPRATFWFAGSLTDTLFLASVDSVTMSVTLVARDTLADGLRILVYRVPRPRSIDTGTTYDSIAPWIHDSLLVDTIPVSDSMLGGQLVRRLPAAAFTPDSADSNIVGAVLVLEAPQATAITLTGNDFTGEVRLNWYARAADTTKTTVLSSAPAYDTFVQSPEPPAMGPDRLFVGGLPAARALLRFDIPRYFIDSTTIVRGVLVLSPVVSIGGKPATSFLLELRGIVRDFGAKSIFASEGGLTGSATLTVGDTAQVRMSVTNILRTWRGFDPDSLPRSVILRIADEGRSLGELTFAPSTAGARAPQLHLTYVRPYLFGVP